MTHLVDPCPESRRSFDDPIWHFLIRTSIDVRTIIVYTKKMKNITLSADEGLLQQARRRAGSEHRTLNDVFRQWLDQYVAQSTASDTYDAMMNRLDHVSAGGKFSREHMNERR
jgi:hypothetical protein